MIEQWARVADAPLYEVSSCGRVRRRTPNDGRTEYVDVATWENHKGYVMVSLEIAGVPRLRYVHRLVLESFRGRDAQRPFANHDDNRKGNNALDNLLWTTSSSNVLHGRRLRAEVVHGQRSLFALLS